MRSRLTAVVAVIAFAAVTVAAGCGSSNNDNSSTSGGTLTAASFSVQADPAIVAPGPGGRQVERPADRGRRRDLRARRVHRPRRQDGDRHGRGHGQGHRPADGPARPTSRTSRSTASSRDWPRASTTSACRRSRTPRTARRRSTSSPTRARARRSIVSADGGPTSPRSTTSAVTRSAPRRAPPQADDATAQNKKCTDAGKPAVSVSVFPDQNGVNLALSSGRVDVAMADTPVAAYAVKQSDGKFKISAQLIRRTRRTGSRWPRTAACSSLCSPPSRP